MSTQALDAHGVALEPCLTRLDAQPVVMRLYNTLDARESEATAACFAADGVWHRQGKQLRSLCPAATWPTW